MTLDPSRPSYTSTHWGTYEPVVEDGRLQELRPYPNDPAPSPIAENIATVVDGPLRIRRPAIRKGWLNRHERADGRRRGGEPFVEVPWDEALDLVAAEIDRIRDQHGNQAIFAGSYGWASAGRFHHANSQIHRFFNTAGGYTRSVNTYSHAAAEVILPRVLGPLRQLLDEAADWPSIAEHGELVVMFGGVPLKNAQVSSGGVTAHGLAGALEAAKRNGVRFVYLGPLQDDAADFLDARWLRPRPNTDVAVMLGIAHTLLEEGLEDRAFLERYAAGFERFVPYLKGEVDGEAKDPAWAGRISGLDPDAIRALARDMAGRRTLVSVSWSLQRQDHGEMGYWMAVTLAAMLGQIGFRGGGFVSGLGAEEFIGKPRPKVPFASLPRGENAVADFIPVARIADLLLHPGEGFAYDGGRYDYPDIKMVYWAGGNPFHHHQDLNRLVRAWQRPDTVVVHDHYWNALARHADVVFPASTFLERTDIAAGPHDDHVVAMRQAIQPVGESRTDYAIFSGLALRLGIGEAFTEGRDDAAWLRHLWDRSRQRAAEAGLELPTLEALFEEGIHRLPLGPRQSFLEAFRDDPEGHPLKTPSGRIEIFSETIERFFGVGHPVWREPGEWLGGDVARRFPLHLISNQPRTKLHSQYDHGPLSRAAKVRGREPVLIHPDDAQARGIADGDLVRVFNERGACLGGAV
ncbi:MAG: molybdopterin-dependent oxidoreductase, partial [Geminicoccaceae bacterium]|nr:molybdopterin-dependent oxidoreductase [Geminicoccaceae bacterium]